MADDPRPPVAVRITRPYASEEEYLDSELDLLSRTGITLVGAQPRPQGVVLRFELVLSGGQVLLRGEGRVVGFKPNAHQGVGGLTLRFTRVDARSKVLLDRAAAMRDQRRPSGRPGRPPLTLGVEGASTSDGEKPFAPSSPGGGPIQSPSETTAPVSMVEAPPTKAKALHEGTLGIEMPLDARDALLDRLRARARTLDETAVRRILEQGRHHA